MPAGRAPAPTALSGGAGPTGTALGTHSSSPHVPSRNKDTLHPRFFEGGQEGPGGPTPPGWRGWPGWQ